MRGMPSQLFEIRRTYRHTVRRSEDLYRVHMERSQGEEVQPMIMRHTIRFRSGISAAQLIDVLTDAESF